MSDYVCRKLSPPLRDALSDNLEDFWQSIFQAVDGSPKAILCGEEINHNTDRVYVACHGEEIAATVQLTISGLDRRLGGLSNVATAERHRGKHLASRLCAAAATDFDRAGGEALFLGTVNPIAARVYRKTGWVYIPGTKVMVRLRESQLPEEFMINVFQVLSGQSVSIQELTPSERINIIPLILFPHQWVVLDMNVDLFSTRFATQISCMGLFPRYRNLLDEGGKAWLAIARNSGPMIGIATAKPVTSEMWQVDGFAHPYFTTQHTLLMDTVIKWGGQQGLDSLRVQFVDHDFEKIECYKNMGFAKRSIAPEVKIAQNTYRSCYLYKALQHTAQ